MSEYYNNLRQKRINKIALGLYLHGKSLKVDFMDVVKVYHKNKSAIYEIDGLQQDLLQLAIQAGNLDLVRDFVIAGADASIECPKSGMNAEKFLSVCYRRPWEVIGRSILVDGKYIDSPRFSQRGSKKIHQIVRYVS